MSKKPLVRRRCAPVSDVYAVPGRRGSPDPHSSSPGQWGAEEPVGVALLYAWPPRSLSLSLSLVPYRWGGRGTMFREGAGFPKITQCHKSDLPGRPSNFTVILTFGPSLMALGSS